MEFRFAIYGVEEGEFSGALSLDNLQRLADACYYQTGKWVAAIVANHQTRRQLLRFLESDPSSLKFEQVAIEACRAFPDDLICMKPHGWVAD